MTMTEEQLVQQLRRNELGQNETFLTQIYEDCYFLCEQMILKNSGTKEDAKDLFQDAMVVFYSKVKEEDFMLTSKLSTYLFAITRNLWLKRLRNSKHFADVDEQFLGNIEGGVAIPEEKVYSDTCIMLAELLEKSGEKCRGLLKMFYYERLKMSEISDVLGFSSGQVAKNQKVRCLKKIRAILSNEPKYREVLNR